MQFEISFPAYYLTFSYHYTLSINWINQFVLVPNNNQMNARSTDSSQPQKCGENGFLKSALDTEPNGRELSV